MVKCDFPGCDNEEVLPFRCKYCGKQFCVKHRLPEYHNCEKINTVTSPGKKTQKVLIARTPPSNLSNIQSTDASTSNLDDFALPDFPEDDFVPYYQTDDKGQISLVKPRESRIRDKYFLSMVSDSFSVGAEILDILIGLLSLVVSFGFTAVLMSNISWTYSGFLVALITGCFFLFIYTKKFVAKKFNCESRFVLTKLGMILTLITLFSPIKFLNPGKVVIPSINYLSKKKKGLISVSGLSLLIVLGAAYILLGWLLPYDKIAFLFVNGTFFVSQLAIVYLIPFKNTDGQRIMAWNWIVYSIMIISSIALLVGTFFLGILNF